MRGDEVSVQTTAGAELKLTRVSLQCRCRHDAATVGSEQGAKKLPCSEHLGIATERFQARLPLGIIKEIVPADGQQNGSAKQLKSFVVTLGDGTRLTGTVSFSHVVGDSERGTAKVPLEEIRFVRFSKPKESADVSASKGTHLAKLVLVSLPEQKELTLARAGFVVGPNCEWNCDAPAKSTDQMRFADGTVVKWDDISSLASSPNSLRTSDRIKVKLKNGSLLNPIPIDAFAVDADATVGKYVIPIRVPFAKYFRIEF